MRFDGGREQHVPGEVDRSASPSDVDGRRRRRRSCRPDQDVVTRPSISVDACEHRGRHACDHNYPLVRCGSSETRRGLHDRSSSARSSSAASRWTTPAPGRRTRWTGGTPTSGVEGDDRLRQLGDRGRAARLRLVLDHRAPLPARGLRGDPQRDPALDVDRRPHRADPPRHDVQRRAAVEPDAPRRGLLDAPQPVRRPRRSSASGAAPCRARCCTSTTRACRSGPTTTPIRRPTTSATGGCSRSRWRSSGWRSPTRRSPSTASTSRSRCPASPTAAGPCNTSRWCRGRCYPYEIWQAVTSPPTLRVRAGGRPRRRVLEPALLVHQALLGHLRRALRAAHDGRAGRRREADARGRRARRGHPREGVRDRDARPRRVLEVPRAVRLEPRLHGRGRQAGQARSDPDARRVDREQDDPRSARRRRSPRAIAVLPRPARRRAPDDLPPPARRPLQEGRRADGALHRRGRPAASELRWAWQHSGTSRACGRPAPAS